MTSCSIHTNLLQHTKHYVTLENTAVLKIWSIVIGTIEGREEAARVFKDQTKNSYREGRGKD